MNDIQIFRNAQFGEIRVVERDGEPWFIGKDVAGILGYSNTRDALSRHVDDEDKNSVVIHDGIPGNPNQVVINESGLYSLILSSKLPAAKQFKRWVTGEVLPTIRNHGAYMTPETIEKTLTNPNFIIQLATQLKDEQEKRQALEAEAEANAPKVLFADSVETSNCSILVGQLAKQLRQNGIEIGQQRLFKRLREEGYLCSSKGERYNMPTQRAMEMGLFEIKERAVSNPDGSVRITVTPLVSGKGQIYFTNRYLKQWQAEPRKSVLQRILG